MRSFRPGSYVLGIMVLALALATGHAAEPVEEDALTLLEVHCVKCHGGEKTKGGLDLVTREGLLRGGESGPSIEPGAPADSLLLQTVRHEADPPMPHKKAKLSDAAVARIAAWVAAGAPYSRPLARRPPGAVDQPPEFAVTDEDRAHWAFQRIKRPSVPAVRDLQRVANPIDSFIVAELEKRGRSLAPEATPEALIRRVTFDLIGLPPTPEEVDTFAHHWSTDRTASLERLIDRLLASPHYGERWGRHWLDLARFAESDGFEHDEARPHAWRYRDYVVASFNADKPYDRFVREQLAGDELWPAEPDALVATGFNLLGPDMVDSSDQAQRRHNRLNDIADTAALAFLGLTVGCARCHDHKFEPISQRDYYNLQAYFTPAAFRPDQPVPTAAARAAHETATRAYDELPLVRALAEIESPVREALRREKLAKLSPEARAAHAVPSPQRTAEQANLVLETEVMVAVGEKELTAAFTAEDAARRKDLLAKVERVPKPRPLPKAMALGPGDDGAKTFVLHRGEYTQPGDEAQPAVPTVLRETGTAAHPLASRRASLSSWIASPENPLTARVMINRIWQHHFGRGLVGTPSDFGTHGQKPTHPELLDWLASEFIQRGWSMKQMHKLMLMSATYRQTSAATAASAKADPENRYYARMNRLRLEGEAIRDSLLAIGGRLNPEIGGPGVFPPLPKNVFDGARGWPKNSKPADDTRRSIYIFSRRNLRFPFLEVFDAPDNNLSCPLREKSTTAPQSLTLLNADEVTAAAAATAGRITREAATLDEQIILATRLALGRPPRPTEVALAREFLAHSPLTEYCRALFNLNDFIYVE